MNFCFITSNIHKLRAAERVFGAVDHRDIELPEIQHIDPIRIINAKLQAALHLVQSPAVVEDSSLSLHCLNGLPGPLIKWFLSSIQPQGIAELVHRYPDHRAVAGVFVGYQQKGMPPQFFSGEIEGIIVSPRGDNGFGYDCIFQPNGSDFTLGELKGADYDNMSPRTVAFQKLNAFLKKTASQHLQYSKRTKSLDSEENVSLYETDV